jgi:hypothetical protein
MLAGLSLLGTGVAAAQPGGVRSADEAISAIRRARAFLLADQNPDGSWGGARGAVYTFTGDVWTSPETHKAWRVATTGLCVCALLPADGQPERDAAERGLDWLLTNAQVKRPNEWDTMNNWAYIYSLQAFAAASRRPEIRDSPRYDAMRRLSEALVRRLRDNEGLGGGWGYLEFDLPRTAQPQWSTSFTSAAGVVALLDAKAAGLACDEGMLSRAVRAVQRCAMPSGAYTYSVQAVADPRHSEWIDQVKGSLGRTQACNYARLASGERLAVERLARGLDEFFRFHRFMDIARNRPIPHEAYYLNSGYFYLFGHYYAGRLVRRLPPEAREAYAGRLRHEVMKIQQVDGSFYDYDMHAYHKPYGTALAVLALHETTRGGDD